MSSANNKRRVRKSEPVPVRDPPKQNVKLVGRATPIQKNQQSVTKLESKDPLNRPKSAVNNRRSYSPSTKPTASAARPSSAVKTNGKPAAPSIPNKPDSNKPTQSSRKLPQKTASDVVGRSRVLSAASKFNKTPANNAERPRSVSDAPVRDTKPVANKKPTTTTNSSNTKSNVKPINGVSYTPSKESVVLPNFPNKPPIPDNTKSKSPNLKKGNGIARIKAHADGVKKPVTAVVAPIQQSKTVKPLKLGHNFQPHELTDWVTWCDACGSIILSIGLFGKCVSCKKCKMVCHGKCAQTVSLTCEADAERSLKANNVDASWYKTIVQETKDESTLKEYNTIKRVIPKEELVKRIEAYNLTVKGTQGMTLLEDNETFRGFIRVQINLSRPVSVQDNTKTLNHGKSKLNRSSSFYIDKGAVKALYLTSTHTSEEVIEALLKKYSITDNVHKFALFEKQVRDGEHIILRKMLASERPLFLRLLWGDGNSQNRAFYLQENETREIQWESFSPAELNTFLKILLKEENDHRKNIEERYEKHRQVMLRAIQYQKNLH